MDSIRPWKFFCKQAGVWKISGFLSGFLFCVQCTFGFHDFHLKKLKKWFNLIFILACGRKSSGEQKRQKSVYISESSVWYLPLGSMMFLKLANLFGTSNSVGNFQPIVPRRKHYCLNRNQEQTTLLSREKKLGVQTELRVVPFFSSPDHSPLARLIVFFAL